MTEKKNFELNDEQMVNASGGVNSAGDYPFPAKYKVGDKVICPQRPDFGSGTILKIYPEEDMTIFCWYYDVQFPDFALEPGFIYDGLVEEAMAYA